MANPIEYEVPTWNQIYEMLLEQSEKIHKNRYQPDIIVGIARGGIIPASILTDLLKTQITTTIRIEFYLDIAQPNIQPTLKQPLTVPVNGKKILIVDDISDSGQSLKIAKQHLTEKGATEIKIATLYTKTTTQIPPDYVEKTTNNWVVFPWEIKETLQSILQKHNDKRAANNEFAKLVKAGLPKQLFEQILKTL
ncbi:MAG: phosphoribosyltransferase [Candidatus Bathyarchaeota archaeon]|nr:phosphoribosyltransferase [Candidatus Termiticorpusculum sp.]